MFDPYFKVSGENRLMPMVMKAKDVTPEIITYINFVIKRVKKHVSLPGMPFINTEYVNKFWVNFKASYNRYAAMKKERWEAYLQIRINRIFSNLTDDLFFGKQLKLNKSIMCGGAEHGKIYSTKKDSKLLKMEGWLLNNNYAPTKGKVFSIKVVSLAYNIPEEYYTADDYKRGTEQLQILWIPLKKWCLLIRPTTFALLTTLQSSLLLL